MNIYILEDDLMQQTRISDIIRELVSEGTFSVRKLEVFSKPHKLLSSINEKGNHQVFLLDIDIDGERKKGLEVASEIRQQDALSLIHIWFLLKSPRNCFNFIFSHGFFKLIIYRSKTPQYSLLCLIS